MYFKLLHQSRHVNQRRCIHSVSASNSSAYTFPSALALAVYCHNQKDNCETLIKCIRLASPPPLWACYHPLLSQVYCNIIDMCKLHCRYCKAPMLSKSIDAACHSVQVKDHFKRNVVLEFRVNLESTNLRLLPRWNFRSWLLLLLQCHNSSTSCFHILSRQNYENSFVHVECCFAPFAERSQCKCV